MLRTGTVFFACLIFLSGLAQTEPLFRIVQNDKVGYINARGQVVISPTFLNGNEFAEGLATVRKDGLYGFVDQTGEFVIQPEFDLATCFVNGITVVYKKGRPYFIDKTGKAILPARYNSFTFLNNRKGIIATTSGRRGVMDLDTKKLLIDTLFKSISGFTNGVAIVEEFIPPSKDRKQSRVGVIDSTGKWIVPFGKYEKINPFSEGVAVVEIADGGNKDDSYEGAIDTRGNLLFKKSGKDNYIDGDFHDGYAKISLLKQDGEGFIDLKGTVVSSHIRYKRVYDFSNSRAFAQGAYDNYLLIGKDLKPLTGQGFRDVLDEKFNNNYAMVETDDGWGIIDTTGRFVVKPQYEEIDQAGILGNYFFFVADSTDHRFYGIADLGGRTILNPVMQEFDCSGFVNGLLKATVDDRLTYIDKQGSIVWQQQEDTSTTLKLLNIDFMNRGYFYAYSTPKNTEADYSGGWAVSRNMPKKITGGSFLPDQLSMMIDTTLLDTFANRFYGYKLFISNRTGDTVRFNAQDSRLYVKLQAQNETGEWKDIEYLPSSWCGNSYHELQLELGAFWGFTIPQYNGQFPTLVRAELRYIPGKDPKTEKVIYSNPVSASINPAQFWNKRAYYPGGLMDPYYE